VTRHHQVWHFHSNRSSAVLSKALNTFKYLLGKKERKKERGKKKKQNNHHHNNKKTQLCLMHLTPHRSHNYVQFWMREEAWKGRKIKFTYALAKLISFEEIERTSINSL